MGRALLSSRILLGDSFTVSAFFSSFNTGYFLPCVESVAPTKKNHMNMEEPHPLPRIQSLKQLCESPIKNPVISLSCILWFQLCVF